MTTYTPNISVPLYHCARVSTFKHFVDKFNTWFSKLTEKWKRLNQWLNISVIFITLCSYKHFLPVMRTLFINSWSPDISKQWSHNNIKIINCPRYILYSLKDYWTCSSFGSKCSKWDSFALYMLRKEDSALL